MLNAFWVFILSFGGEMRIKLKLFNVKKSTLSDSVTGQY